MNQLWSFHDLLDAIQGEAVDKFPAGFVSGISIDSRSIVAGDVFFALKGERYDGHDYVLDAVNKGASIVVIDASMISSIGQLSVPIFLVKDVLLALNNLAIASRLRSNAKIIAVTGSVGKTTTKEMLKLALSSVGKTHASINSYNNRIGVPLTLACMPHDAEFGFFELGMSAPNEIRFLTRLVRPHMSIITTIAPAHIGNFSNLNEIAAAKAEIFEELENDGSVLLNHDNPYFDFLANKARDLGINKIYSFGKSVDADFRLIKFQQLSEKSLIKFQINDHILEVIIATSGKHMAYNVVATLGIVAMLDVDVAKSINALATFKPQKGRGKRYHLALKKGYFTLIDESYNANPASMKAAISVLSKTSPYGTGRRIAVLGDMCEMGKMSKLFHINLAKVLCSHNISHVWLTGVHMVHLKNALSIDINVKYFTEIVDLFAFIKTSVIQGDVMVVKSSNMCGLHQLVQLMLKEFIIVNYND
ncbi:UDP-N-acetylmuramoyl-tripeptide--D-alanyl-D-alanine ligase [Candidatus Liberibacter americanus]|uniref:UDP-N-acetylmuramoyl-tripeptide--D-alanyl-D-alanine ligase n=1 Tax=Candidatus Liberibacter americanus str. Sao Paulo TaxID=1261131 RepID=U6B7X9_9HYPH|nr:UDP-N-acetylmuramoyl-tripeptide--D-alanyl-D-alanine ligase [Candidatus Liberibacter americanus]AHA27832.1 UDP-N-acetylmuramyl pentapeptide synthase [Candidatus Liberibacter americanus str. Sao Paulo]EMS35999.1 UDP-N-acetylmuramoylalanyl-D-glutamyl-2, 6-diaminopimelate/D-alanyl-D-alanyl ligase [Candidatus Liberibacter americanus PW_SP]